MDCTEYKIVTADRVGDLEEVVCMEILKGYKPCGGVAVVCEAGDRPVYLQALTREASA